MIFPGLEILLSFYQVFKKQWEPWSLEHPVPRTAHKKNNRLEFFLNGAELSLNSANSGNLLNHWSMNWAQFKDPVSYMCLAGTVVAYWSLTQEVAGSSPFTVKTNIFVTEFAEFNEKNEEKLHWELY